MQNSLMSRSGGLTVAEIFCHHKHLVSKCFLPVTDTVFRAEMWRGVGRTGGRTDASPFTAAVFISSLPKTVTVTTLP